MVPGVSRAQLEWLMWLQHQPICVDKNGQRQPIRHALNHGEFEVNGRPVDGYLQKDGQEYFFEFLGCYWHPGCCVPDSMIKEAAAKRKSDAEKFEMLRQRGKSFIFYNFDKSFIFIIFIKVLQNLKL